MKKILKPLTGLFVMMVVLFLAFGCVTKSADKGSFERGVQGNSRAQSEMDRAFNKP